MYHMQYTQYGHCYDLKHNNATMCIDVNNVRCTCIPRQIFTGEQAQGGDAVLHSHLFLHLQCCMPDTLQSP